MLLCLRRLLLTSAQPPFRVVPAIHRSLLLPRVTSHHSDGHHDRHHHTHPVVAAASLCALLAPASLFTSQVECDAPPVVILSFSDAHTSAAAGQCACERAQAWMDTSVQPAGWMAWPTPRAPTSTATPAIVHITLPPHTVRDAAAREGETTPACASPRVQHMRCSEVTHVRARTPGDGVGHLKLSGCSGGSTGDVTQHFRHVIVCPRAVGPAHACASNAPIMASISERALHAAQVRFIRPQLTNEVRAVHTTDAAGGDARVTTHERCAAGDIVAIVGGGLEAVMAVNAHLPLTPESSVHMIHPHTRLLPHMLSPRACTTLTKRMKRAGVRVHGYTGVNWLEVEQGSHAATLYTCALYDRLITDAHACTRVWISDETGDMGGRNCDCEALHVATATAASEAHMAPPARGPGLDAMIAAADFTLGPGISVVGGRYMDAATHACTWHPHDVTHASRAAEHATDAVMAGVQGVGQLQTWNRGYTHTRVKSWDAPSLGFRGVSIGDVRTDTSVCVFDFHQGNAKRGNSITSPLDTCGATIGVSLHTRVCPRTSTITCVGVSLWQLYAPHAPVGDDVWTAATEAIATRAKAVIHATCDVGIDVADRATLTSLLHVAAFALAQESALAVGGALPDDAEWLAPNAHVRVPTAAAWIPPAGTQLAAMSAAVAASAGGFRAAERRFG